MKERCKASLRGTNKKIINRSTQLNTIDFNTIDFNALEFSATEVNVAEVKVARVNAAEINSIEIKSTVATPADFPTSKLSINKLLFEIHKFAELKAKEQNSSNQTLTHLCSFIPYPQSFISEESMKERCKASLRGTKIINRSTEFTHLAQLVPNQCSATLSPAVLDSTPS